MRRVRGAEMEFQEYQLDQKLLRHTYQDITSFAENSHSQDPTIGALLKNGAMIKKRLSVLENLCKTSLPRLLVHARDMRTLTAPDTLQEVLQLLSEGTLPPEELEAVKKEAEPLNTQRLQACDSILYGTDGGTPGLLSFLNQLRDQCYPISQSDLAKHVIDVYHNKRKRLQQLTAWSQNTLLPLIEDLQSQLNGIDSAMATYLDKNFFDDVLAILPDSSTLSDLGTRTDTSLFSTAPATTRTVPDANRQTASTTQNAATQTNTQSTPPSNVPTIIQLGGGGNDSAPAGDLSAATPEAVALKASYEALKNVLNYLSGSVTFARYVEERAQLREQLDQLTQRYQEAMEQYRCVASDLEALDSIRVLLDHASLYVGALLLLESSLHGYFDALQSLRLCPEDFQQVLELYIAYLDRLELCWR